MLLTNDDADSEFESVRLGKKIELKYIPFSELSISWNMCFDTNMRAKIGNKEALRNIKTSEIKALKNSISRFGLLKPFEVAELHERLNFFYGKGRYIVIDGQRRYFAIRDLLKLPTEDDEKQQKEKLRTDCQNYAVMIGEKQAQEQFDRLSVRDHVLIPCLVYPYKTLLEMLRHSMEGRRCVEKPSKSELALAAAMGAEGIGDLTPDDLRALWTIRHQIDEEKQIIEQTLKEIRSRVE